MKDTGMYRLYNQDIPATRTGLFYNLFSYPTKISPEVIAIYISTHTHVNDVVLDTFGGSGTTAIAARLCEYPNEKMLELVRQLDLVPEWGPRKVIVYEIGQYGYFAANTMMNAPDALEFRKAANELLCRARKDLGMLYEIKDNEGKVGEIRHIIWSNVVKCAYCKGEVSYYDVAVKSNPFSIEKSGKCPQCGQIIDLEKCEYVTCEEYDELLHTKMVVRKRIPKKIYGITGSRKWSRMATEEDIRLYRELPFTFKKEPEEIVWGDLYRAGYHQGITHLHHFYTRRNYCVMSNLWKYTEQYDKKIRKALQLMLLSYNAAHSTLMTRVVVKKKSTDFVLTGAQSGVLYISNLPVEKNIILGIERKIAHFTEAFQFMNRCKGEAVIYNVSSINMSQIGEESIDYIFTDPPFGDYIPYSEVNQINELWIEKSTDRNKEIIISSAQNKGIVEYENMLSQVFKEMNRVLKNSGKMTVVFHSSKANVWKAMRNAMEKADMFVERASILDKVQGSFKQVTADVSVKGDPIMLLTKSEKSKTCQVSFEKVVQNHLLSGDKDEQHIYSDYIVRCLRNQNVVKIDAKDAYKIIRKMAGANNG